MIIKYSPNFEKGLKKRLVRTPSLKKKVGKQIMLLQKDIRHPSLKVHKLKGSREDQYSFWIEGNIRITFVIFEEAVYLTDIITHDEY